MGLGYEEYVKLKGAGSANSISYDRKTSKYLKIYNDSITNPYRRNGGRFRYANNKLMQAFTGFLIIGCVYKYISTKIVFFKK